MTHLVCANGQALRLDVHWSVNGIAKIETWLDEVCAVSKLRASYGVRIHG